MLNEFHHAFISATFFKYLKAQFPKCYEAVFTLATQRYGEQRGNRMAQRAIRDGAPLDFASYRYYGEWLPSEDYQPDIGKERVEAVKVLPDYTYRVHACPWSEQYLKMGLLDGANLYCAHLDKAIARGFNPYLVFDVTKTMHETNTYCEHTQRDSRFDSDYPYGSKNPENIRCFDYHCGHIYKTYSEIITSILKSEGAKIAAHVLSDFSSTYGVEAANILINNRYENFDTI